jgi:hypothetical protein
MTKERREQIRCACVPRHRIDGARKRAEHCHQARHRPPGRTSLPQPCGERGHRGDEPTVAAERGTGERESRARPRLVDRPGPATRASRRPDQAGEPSGSTESHGSVRTSPEAAVLEQPRPFGLGRYHRHVEAPHRVRRAARSMAGTAATWASVDCERGSTFLESKCFSTCRGRAFGHHGRTPRAMACMARSRGAWPLPAAPHQLAEACDRAGCVARMGRRKSCIRQGANSAH